MIFKEKKEYYSLRKFKGVGLASALVGLSFMSQGVLAEESPVVSPNGSSNSVVVPNPTADKQKVEGDVKPTTEVASPMTTNTSVKETVENTDNLKETDSADKSEVADVVNSSVESVVEDKKPVVTNVVSSENKPVSEGVAEITESKEKEVGGKPDTTSPSTTLVPTESTQPVRSRRGKRSTSENPATIVNLPLNYGNASIPMNVSNITETNKIDYTTSSNPSLESDISDKKVYNNQIESIEKVSTANKDSHRFRIKLKDGQTIPNGGKLVLATLGGGSPTSKELVLGSETVGKITEFRPSTKGTNTLADRLNSSTTVADYIRTFENMSTKDLPANSLVLEFNSNFSKYNLNRLVEFELESRTLNLVDYSLVRKNGLSSSSDAVIDSSGTSHTLEKRFTSYLLNPYDSKGLALDNTKAYISVKSAPTGTPVFNELTVDMDWGYATKPNYLDTVYTPATGSFKVSNRESSADSIIARKGSLLTYRLPDDSLFATSKYSVGDIVSVTYLDNVLNEERVSSNRFTDTDNYVNVEKSAADSSQNRKGFAKFKLVERTDKGYKWELLEDISMKNSTFYMDTESLTPVEFRSDWVSKFGEANLKRFLEGTTRSASSYLGKEQLKAYVTWTSNGVTKDVSKDGLINKNTNLILGENTTGTLKVVHKSDTGEILKAESVVADNKPWYTPVTIDPQNFDGYQFKRSSEVLSTIVGSGTRTIELIYAKPSERVSKEPIPVTYVVDNTKDGNYRNEVVGTPKITTTRTEYIYSADTRTSTSKETVTVQEGTPTVVTLGTKPTTEVTYQDFTTRYVADPTRTAGEKFTETAGVRGTTTTETTYSVNKETGVVTPTKGQPVVVAPKEAVVKVGTKPTITETSIPVTTKYKADNSIDFGKEEVESQGQAGTRTTTTPKVLNTTNGMVSDGQPTTKETPMTPKVVKKGTKPKVVETPVNFDTVYEADETKGKGVRTDKVVGVRGKVITTTTYTLNETTGVVTTNNPTERRENPINKVVTIGTAPTVATKRIAHGVEYQRDDTVSASAAPTRVQDGVDGEKRTTTTYNVNPTTGLITENKPVETTVASKPQIEKLGTKPEDIVTTQDFKRTFVADENKDLGYRQIETQGVRGKTVVHRTYTLPENVPPVEDNGQAINYEFAVAIPHDSEPVVTVPVNEVTRVGVKPKVETQTIAVTTKYIADENLEFGKVVETEKGSEGRVVTTTTYTMNPTDGTTTANKPTVDTTPMVQRVVKVGVKKKVVETPIEFTTRYERDEEVETGKKTPSVSGITGKTITTTTYTMNPTTGVVTENPSTTVREEPTTAVVKVGTKPKVVTEVLSKTTRYEVDPTKTKGETEVIDQGSDGSVVTTTPYVLNEKDGSVSEGKSTTVRTEPKERVIKVGTQPKVVVEKVEKTTRYEADPTKPKDEKEISTEGSDGSVTTTTPYVLNKENGSVTEGTPIVEKIPAVEKVVKVGAQPKVEETPLPFTTSYEADPSVDKGSTSDKFVGKDGKVTTTTTYSIDPKTGEVSENPSTSVREEPVSRVVSVGSKPTTVVTEQEYFTRYVGDSSKEVGFKETREKGVKGTTSVTTTYSVDPTSGKITPKEGSPVVVAPKEEVIALGNKSKVEVETLPKTTRYEKDSEKDKGVSTTSVEGSDGSKTTTTTYTVNSKTGEVTPSTPIVETVPAVEKVIKVGAKDKVEVTPIPSPVRYEGDTSVEKGSPNKEVKGIDGSSTVTTTYSVDSKIGFVTETVGTPVVVKATETVIKVGAKSKVVVTPIPVEVEEVDDPDLFEGDENVTSNGKSGSTTTTTEYVVNPTTGEITEKDPVVSTIPMEKKVVHKGTKKRKATVTISYVLKDNGSALGSPTVLENQQVGSPYNTSVKVFEPKVEVRELIDRTVTKTTSYVLEKEPENKSGIVTEQGVSVVYTYRALVREEAVMKESKLIVNFVLEGSGEKLHESLVKEGVRVGDPYVTEPLALKDKVEKRVERNKEVVTTTKYEVVETPKNARGLIEVGGTSVTFTYRAVVSSEEYPTIPSEAPKVDEVEYTEPIHVNGPVETLDLPEFTGGVNPYDAPIYEKPELKVEEPAFKPIIGDSFPKKEVPVEVPNKVSDSEKDKPLSPREETPSIDGLETPKQVLTSNSSQKPQNAPDLISISQVEKVTHNYQTSPKQAPSGSEQFLPNTGGSESDKLASLSGIGLLGLLGLAGLRKSKED